MVLLSKVLYSAASHSHTDGRSLESANQLIWSNQGFSLKDTLTWSLGDPEIEPVTFRLLHSLSTYRTMLPPCLGAADM